MLSFPALTMLNMPLLGLKNITRLGRRALCCIFNCRQMPCAPMRLVSLLAISGIVLLGGLAVSYAGSELATADLVTEARSLEAGGTLVARADLAPTVSRNGVYAAKSVGQDHEGIVLRVTNPAGATVDMQEVRGDSGEAEFVVTDAGEYTLEASNTSQGTRDIVIAIGYKADDLSLAVVAVGSYLIIAGMVVMASSMIYSIAKSRIKR